jgi:hypothetical protein
VQVGHAVAKDLEVHLGRAKGNLERLTGLEHVLLERLLVRAA